jgi:hypothetical protein
LIVGLKQVGRMCIVSSERGKNCRLTERAKGVGTGEESAISDVIFGELTVRYYVRCCFFQCRLQQKLNVMHPQPDQNLPNTLGQHITTRDSKKHTVISMQSNPIEPESVRIMLPGTKESTTWLIAGSRYSYSLASPRGVKQACADAILGVDAAGERVVLRGRRQPCYMCRGFLCFVERDPNLARFWFWAFGCC